MKRLAVHLAFGGATLVFAAVALFDFATLQHAHAVARAVSAVSAKGAQPQSLDDAAQVRLARAVVSSKAGDYAGAQKLYDSVLVQDNDAALQTAALFDLANMSLRQAAGPDAGGPVRSLPLLEQAKERYRSALRLTPDDWDARYNLERALWLAPEGQTSDEERDYKHQATVKARGAQSEDLP
ncbi:MxaL protein [Caballeronia sp. HLA56]